MENTQLPQPIKVIKSNQLTKKTVLVTFDFSFNKFVPGQFLMLSVPGFGEAPFGIMQPAIEQNRLQLLINNVGQLTNRIYNLKKNDIVCIRGPYGNGFPINELKNKNLALFAGGTGIVPIKALMDYIYQKNNFGNVQLFYGAKDSESIFFQKEFKRFEKFAEIMLTIEKHSRGWNGNIGLITNLITSKTVLSENTVSVLCGPPIMYKFIIDKLKKLDFSDQQIYLSLERRMRCGIGKCQHCTCGDKYVCIDGPVFRYDEVLKFPEGI
jgi:NAD(P)H-flavin reductase